MSTSSHSFQETQRAECCTCSDVCRAVQHCDRELAMKSVLFLAAALHPEPCTAYKRWKMLQRDGLISFFPSPPPHCDWFASNPCAVAAVCSLPAESSERASYGVYRCRVNQSVFSWKGGSNLAMSEKETRAAAAKGKINRPLFVNAPQKLFAGWFNAAQ